MFHFAHFFDVRRWLGKILAHFYAKKWSNIILHVYHCMSFYFKTPRFFFCGSNLFIKKNLFWNIIYFFDINGLTHWTYLTFVNLKLILVFTYKDLWSLHYTRITLDSSQFFKCLNMTRSPSRVWIVIVRSRFFYWSKISLFFLPWNAANHKGTRAHVFGR